MARFFLSLTLILAFLTPVRADTPPEIAKLLPAAGVVGEVTVKAFGITLYDAHLFTASGKKFDWNQTFALKLNYRTRIPGNGLIRGTIKELERMEGVKPDHPEIREKLAGCFYSVRSGDRYVAIPKGANTVEFWRNGARDCALTHPGIRDRVLGIWLSDKARDPALSRQLRGSS